MTSEILTIHIFWRRIENIFKKFNLPFVDRGGSGPSYRQINEFSFSYNLIVCICWKKTFSSKILLFLYIYKRSTTRMSYGAWAIEVFFFKKKSIEKVHRADFVEEDKRIIKEEEESQRRSRRAEEKWLGITV